MDNITIDLTTPTRRRYKIGDYVLYRSADLYWAGQERHTFPCRVGLEEWDPGLYRLTDLGTGEVIRRADSKYMRLLPPAECMRDIDTADLDHADQGLVSAPVAYLSGTTAVDDHTTRVSEGHGHG